MTTLEERQFIDRMFRRAPSLASRMLGRLVGRRKKLTPEEILNKTLEVARYIDRNGLEEVRR